MAAARCSGAACARAGQRCLAHLALVCQAKTHAVLRRVGEPPIVVGGRGQRQRVAEVASTMVAWAVVAGAVASAVTLAGRDASRTSREQNLVRAGIGAGSWRGQWSRCAHGCPVVARPDAVDGHDVIADAEAAVPARTCVAEATDHHARICGHRIEAAARQTTSREEHTLGAGNWCALSETGVSTTFERRRFVTRCARTVRMIYHGDVKFAFATLGHRDAGAAAVWGWTGSSRLAGLLRGEERVEKRSSKGVARWRRRLEDGLRRRVGRCPPLDTLEPQRRRWWHGRLVDEHSCASCALPIKKDWAEHKAGRASVQSLRPASHQDDA